MKKLVPLLLLAVMFIASCTGGPITITGPSQLPVINSFNASPASISAGESSSLNWTVTSASTVSIDQGIGNVALTGTRSVAPAANTIYTLTASSSAGSVTASTQVIVSGVPSPPAPAALPVINSFTASPSSISLGGSTSLSWNVSNATSVAIDNGVGPVSSAGTTIVSPATSTNYILTATNAAGWTSLTVTVVVGGAPAAGMPDLIITDVMHSGSTVTYTIKNQGDAAAGPSTSTLIVDGATVANDSVGSLAPGESRTETFAGYTYTCTGLSDAIVVKADTGNAVVESSEANNSYAESWGCLKKILEPLYELQPNVAYDFVEQAPTAYWWTKVGASIVVLPFPGATNDSRGFATYQNNIKLNDGNTYTKVLETHPQWVNNGWISGKYSGVYVPPGAKLRIKVGLINGASAGNVAFYIGKLGDPATISAGVAYADGVKVVEADLSAYAGQTIDFVLDVNANGSSAQDWASWAEAEIIY